jgi:hypothetical protein
VAYFIKDIDESSLYSKIDYEIAHFQAILCFFGLELHLCTLNVSKNSVKSEKSTPSNDASGAIVGVSMSFGFLATLF